MYKYQKSAENFFGGFLIEKAELYTRDPAIIRQLDSLVTEYPDTFKCVGETDIDKTYVMPKTAVTYRKPRRISEAKREQARQAMKKINASG